MRHPEPQDPILAEDIGDIVHTLEVQPHVELSRRRGKTVAPKFAKVTDLKRASGEDWSSRDAHGWINHVYANPCSDSLGTGVDENTTIYLNCVPRQQNEDGTLDTLIGYDAIAEDDVVAFIPVYPNIEVPNQTGIYFTGQVIEHIGITGAYQSPIKPVIDGDDTWITSTEDPVWNWTIDHIGPSAQDHTVTIFGNDNWIVANDTIGFDDKGHESGDTDKVINVTHNTPRALDTYVTVSAGDGLQAVPGSNDSPLISIDARGHVREVGATNRTYAIEHKTAGAEDETVALVGGTGIDITASTGDTDLEFDEFGHCRETDKTLTISVSGDGDGSGGGFAVSMFKAIQWDQDFAGDSSDVYVLDDGDWRGRWIRWRFFNSTSTNPMTNTGTRVGGELHGFVMPNIAANEDLTLTNGSEFDAYVRYTDGKLCLERTNGTATNYFLLWAYGSSVKSSYDVTLTD